MNSQRSRFEVTPLGNGRFRISDGTRQRLAYAVGPAEARWVFLDGRVYVIDVSTGGRGAAASRRTRLHDDEMALASPMPATVAAIHVREGQPVSRGDLLVVLEAMKMELPIRAPRDGRVTVIACRIGELVHPGVRLVEIQ